MRTLIWAAAALVLACCAAPVPLSAQDKPAAPSVSRPLDLNTATLQQLEALPGIGRSMAQRILDHREKNGDFKKIEELMNVKGIGEKAFLKLKPMITVAAKGGKSGGQS